MDYKSKFLDPRWQKKRLEILERDSFTCRSCYDDTSTLHVHHKYYETGLEPWEYPSESLITLCDDCHKNEEDMIKQYGDLMIQSLRKSIFSADNWRILADGIFNLKSDNPSELVAHAYKYALTDKKMQDLIFNKYISLANKRKKCRK